jgi:hypothetical protein
MLFVRPVERPPTHMQLRIAAPGPLVDLRTVEAAWVQALRERAAANWKDVRKQEALEVKAALHERYRQEDIIACARQRLGMYEHKFLSGPNTLTQAWSELDRYVTPAPVRSVHDMYANNIFGQSFNSSFLRTVSYSNNILSRSTPPSCSHGSRTFAAAQVVMEVD